MEKKLKVLFDFQRFQKSEALEKLIRETERRSERELSDEALTMVAAAGELTEKTAKPAGNGIAADDAAENHTKIKK